MRKLCESPSFVELRLKANYLEREGIHVEILNEHQGGNPGVPHWALSVWAELWVKNPRQFEPAVKALERYHYEQSQNSSEEWVCSSCSESNPINFESCWKCGSITIAAT